MTLMKKILKILMINGLKPLGIIPLAQDFLFNNSLNKIINLVLLIIKQALVK
jgi:hypothetical protein